MSKNATLAYLLTEGVLCAATQRFIEFGDNTAKESTIVISVNANDAFAWGCADGEDIELSEIDSLVISHRNDPKWGMVKDMKTEGARDTAMEILPHG